MTIECTIEECKYCADINDEDICGEEGPNNVYACTRFICGKRHPTYTIRRVKKYLKQWGCVKIRKELI